MTFSPSWAVVGQLQTIRSRHAPGSFRFERADLAVTYALSEERAQDEYLLRNLLRDAGRTLDRRRANYTYHQHSDIGLPPEKALSGEDVALAGGWNPADLLAILQMATKVVTTVSRSSKHASNVLEGILRGETLEETATAAGLSTDRVNQIRRLLRAEFLAALEN
jgi:hypothetical protein